MIQTFLLKFFRRTIRWIQIRHIMMQRGCSLILQQILVPFHLSMNFVTDVSPQIFISSKILRRNKMDINEKKTELHIFSVSLKDQLCLRCFSLYSLEKKPQTRHMLTEEVALSLLKRTKADLSYVSFKYQFCLRCFW